MNGIVTASLCRALNTISSNKRIAQFKCVSVHSFNVPIHSPLYRCLFSLSFDHNYPVQTFFWLQPHEPLRKSPGGFEVQIHEHRERETEFRWN